MIRVLLADDDEGYLESLQSLIGRQPGLAVVGLARDGREALRLADEVAPDAVVVDLHMPELGGVEAIRRLRADHPLACLIALTGDGDAELHRAASHAGADGVFVKGVIVERLRETRG